MALSAFKPSDDVPSRTRIPWKKFSLLSAMVHWLFPNKLKTAKRPTIEQAREKDYLQLNNFFFQGHISPNV